MHLAKNIRANFAPVPTKPGVYKWWCDLGTLNTILEKIDLDKTIDINKNIEKYEHDEHEEPTLYCVYIGIAKNLRASIKWHIKDHTSSQLSSTPIRVSTLRHTLASIFLGTIDLSINGGLNDLIDTFYISFEGNNNRHEVEKAALSKNSPHVYILNIQENEHDLAPKTILKKLRKDAL